MTMATSTPTAARTLAIESHRLESQTARQLVRDAEAAFRAGARNLVIDLAGVSFMDSLGISALVALLRRVPPGGRVALAALTPYALTLVRLTHLHDCFEIFADCDAAMASLHA
jgi:anti-sigma B factor antagonist